MLKKATLAILIASSILGTTVTMAGDKKVEKTVIESPDKMNKVEKTMTIDQKSINGQSYDVSMMTVTFKVTTEELNTIDSIKKINDAIEINHDIIKAINNYGQIISVDTKYQSVISGAVSKSSQTDSIEYVDKVTNGVQSRSFIDIMNFQKFYINTLDKKTVNLFMTVQSAELESMSKTKVGEGSTESYIESPNYSTYTFDQTTKLSTGEYKLINLTGDYAPSNALFENNGNRIYKAVFIKVSEQSS